MAEPQKRPNGLYVTGRLPLLVGLGAVPVVLLSAAGVDAWLTAWGWVALCRSTTPRLKLGRGKWRICSVGSNTAFTRKCCKRGES